MMHAAQQTPVTQSASSLKMLRAMVGIGVICALLIVMTYEGTMPRIKQNKAEALERAVFKVLPGITQKMTYRLDENQQIVPAIDDEQSGPNIHAGFDSNGKLTGLAIEASGMGFADVLRILYGYDPEKQQIVGFYVLESKETPGLGDKIEKDEAFLANFKNLDVSLKPDGNTLANAVYTVKHGAKTNAWEVDGITGATISSRAIGTIISTSTSQMIPLIHHNIETFSQQRLLNQNDQDE